jgi:hypothetical protein
VSAVPNVNAALQAALELAEEHGFPVLPCRIRDEEIDGVMYRAKSPLLTNGFKGASRNIEQIAQWWERWPDALIGVPTGEASGIFVLDIDPRGSTWYAGNAERLSAGRVHHTRRGHHLLYRACGLGCTSNTLADGVDTRGDGGYIIWWPAQSLQTVGGLADVGDLPAWVAEELQAAERKKTERSAASDGGIHQQDLSRDLLSRVGRDVRAGLADYEILARHRSHPHAAKQSEPDRAVQRCIDKTRGEQSTAAPGSGRRGTESIEWQPPAVVSYGADFNPAAIPLRRWLLGRRRSVGELTIDAGPPGVNKSTLMLSDAVQIATGRRILADEVHERGGVVLLAGEDARRDVEAKLAGILVRFDIKPAELEGRLRVVYLAEVDPVSYSLAQMTDDIAMLNVRMFEWLRDYPDTVALFIDPIAAWHRLVENSNEALQLLCASLRGLAVRGQRHVGFDHHVTKVSQFDCEAHVGNLPALRGASAIGAAARWAFTMARIKPETAQAHGIGESERSRYRRLDPLKTSYGPDDEGPRLLMVESVTIANGESVGVLVEQDLEILRAEGKERETSIKESAQRRITEALTRMLTESRPRSANAAALWLITHTPELVQSKKGEVLSEFTLRQRLPSMIGAGLPTRWGERHTRIVIRPAAKNGRGSEIDFETATGAST